MTASISLFLKQAPRGALENIVSGHISYFEILSKYLEHLYSIETYDQQNKYHDEWLYSDFEIDLRAQKCGLEKKNFWIGFPSKSSH